jgi:hypothetical protein
MLMMAAGAVPALTDSIKIVLLVLDPFPVGNTKTFPVRITPDRS